MSKLMRAMVALGILVIAGGVYLYYFGAQTYFAFLARRMGRQVPIVNTVPVELANLTVSQATGEKVSFHGVEFELPWDDVDREKTRNVGNWYAIRFHSDKAIILCVGAPGDFTKGLYKDKVATPGEFKALYGKDVVRSDYALKKAIFETTPRDITLLTPAGKAAGLSAMLLMKA